MQTGKTNIAEERLVRTGITGTGAANPTRRAGAGYTVERTAVGVYRYTFPRHPGTFVGLGSAVFRADAATEVKGYTATAGLPVASGGSWYLDVSVWNSLFAATDLAAAQYLDLSFVFAAQSVIA